MSEFNWSEVARAMAARRRMQEPRTCQICGKDYVGASYSKYCGKSCQQKADYARHAEQRRSSRREKYARQKGSQPPAPTCAPGGEG